MFKRILNSGIYFIVEGIGNFICFLRFEQLDFIAGLTARVLFLLPLKKKHQSIENIAGCFPNMSRSEVNQIALRSVKEVILSALELLYWYKVYSKSADKFMDSFFKYVRWDGSDDLVLDSKRANLILTGHFSNFVVILIYLRLKGKRVSVFLKRLRNRKLQELVDRMMRLIDIEPLYVDRRATIRKAVTTLKNGGIVVALLDQHFGRQGRVEVKFFSRKAYSAKGAVELAVRYGAGILPVLVWRDGRNLLIKVYPEFSSVISKMDAEGIAREFNLLLEREIKKAPENWAWMHNRWKV